MKKRGQVTIWVIIAMFLVGAVIVAMMVWMSGEPTNNVNECQTNIDCAPATCYDPNECVPVSFIEYPRQYYCEDIKFYNNCSTKEVYEKIIGGETINCARLFEWDVHNITKTQICDTCTSLDCDIITTEDKLKDCSEETYIPDCEGLKINLDPRCDKQKGRCVCDTDRKTCKVVM